MKLREANVFTSVCLFIVVGVGMSPVMTTRCHYHGVGMSRRRGLVCVQGWVGIPGPMLYQSPTPSTDTYCRPPKHVQLASGRCALYWNAFLLMLVDIRRLSLKESKF